jgi:hypothetical protein
MSQIDAVRNPDGIFINTNVFREEALHFLKYGYYCPDPWGSPAWKDYWQDQLDRCINGYSSGGVYITGNHYAYLNFAQIKLTKEFKDAKQDVSKLDKKIILKPVKGKGAEKIVTFPDFWDLDYNYFHALDIARWGIDIEDYKKLGLSVKIPEKYLGGGYHMVVLKARRKGYSYKNAFIAANKYNTVPNSITIIGAYDKKYLFPEGTMKMTNDYLNFFNEYTGWAKARDFVDKGEHKKASYEERDSNNITIEKGYKSTIMALSFKDNPESAVGKDASLVLFEEAGKFPNLRSAYMATKPGLEDGVYTTGMMAIFGTANDIESGSADFAEMFYNPTPYNLLPFNNIWDENIADGSKCGFFVPDSWCKPGFIDEHGNSNQLKAKEFELELRQKIIKESTSQVTLNEHIREHPITPSEALQSTNINEFPVQELKNHLNKILAEDLYIKKTQPVHMFRDNETGKAAIKPDLKGELKPIVHYPNKDKDKTGAVVILEPPVPNAPKGLYKLGYDPYRQDQSEGESLGACYVYKSANTFSYTRDTIVAWYIGRPATYDIFNRNVELLAELYNGTIMIENEVPEAIAYFRRRNKLHLLAFQPDAVISKNIKNSRVSRIFGIHMNDKLKDAGEKYIKKWLLEERDVDEHGNTILNLETIYDIGLLEELIAYDRKRNVDRVMAFMMIMFMLEEEEEDKVYTPDDKTKVAKQLKELKMNLYKRQTVLN